ncbi:MAG: transcriptional repressor LexA [Deltaproteobacteria bacterium]|nr:MAG: transcriptional repressor LexA [Deltaproteobacteria bacterium]
MQLETRDTLTKRQQQILDFITASIAERGYPPTLREIGEHFGIRSTNGVNDHLKALEKKGYLRREDLKSRAMRPVTPIASARKPAPVGLGESFVEVPLLGRVAAGEPLLAVEQAEDTVVVDRFFIGNTREVFALRVVGDSMIEDGIHDGDYVFVKKTPTAQRGDTVVAMIEGEATVKRYYPEGDVIRFQPANASMDPIYVRRRDMRSVDILGVVVGVYRKMG